MKMDPITPKPNNNQPSTEGIQLGAGGGIDKGEREIVTLYSLSLLCLTIQKRMTADEGPRALRLGNKDSPITQQVDNVQADS